MIIAVFILERSRRIELLLSEFAVIEILLVTLGIIVQPVASGGGTMDMMMSHHLRLHLPHQLLPHGWWLEILIVHIHFPSASSPETIIRAMGFLDNLLDSTYFHNPFP
jgi:hypothetical protein